MVKKDDRPGGGPKPKHSNMNEKALKHVNSGEEYRRAKERATAHGVGGPSKMPKPDPIPIVVTNPKVIDGE